MVGMIGLNNSGLPALAQVLGLLGGHAPIAPLAQGSVGILMPPPPPAGQGLLG